MTEEDGGCNAASEQEGVLHHLDPAGPVDQRDLEGHLGVLPARLAGKEGAGRGRDPACLPARHAFGGQRMGFRRLDLDEGDPAGLAQDQVDLAAGAAPAPGSDLISAPAVALLHLILGGAAGVPGQPAPQSPAASRSAIW